LGAERPAEQLLRVPPAGLTFKTGMLVEGDPNRRLNDPSTPRHPRCESRLVPIFFRYFNADQRLAMPFA
jgi:hypothetical protein